MWSFRRKKCLVPEGKIKSLLAAMDKAEASRKASDVYAFWRLAADACPETASGKWELCISGVQVWFERV